MGRADAVWLERLSSRPQTSNGKDCPASTKSRASIDTLKITAGAHVTAQDHERTGR
jgi:hypothetical protein